MTSVEVVPGSGTAGRQGDVFMWIGAGIPLAVAERVFDLAGRQAVDGTDTVLEGVEAEAGALDGAGPAALAVAVRSGERFDGVVWGPVLVQNAAGDARAGALSGAPVRFSLPADAALVIWGSVAPTAAPAPAGGAAVGGGLRAGTAPGGAVIVRLSVADTDAEAPGGGTKDAGEGGEAVRPAMPLAPAEVDAIPDDPTGPSDAKPEVRIFDVSTPLPPREPLPVSRKPAAGEDGKAEAVEEVGGAAPADDDLRPPPKTPRPMVRGVRCANAHFNHLDANYCRVCGIGMLQASKVTVMGERPPLGVLVVPDGTTFSLDGDYVIGRRPSGDGDRWVVVDDDRVSRRHAAIHLRDWDVLIEDLGSSNGTYVRNPGAGDWVRVEPGHPVVLENGGQLGVGNAMIVYESVLRRPV